ncbi:hypothetical protein NHX12_027799 [Muraenolepis orangiensis]|uniref:Protein phosphatase 1 regulatory subunit 26 N-terminal domain-containing protein n=1 Tax=Muraenolepis orangiensis TaxID=630683 RepID=A0A9Q0IPK8_9TELE|nr:hypothetical protein NHX12_027799 [Muraenolepis orangiensis]
MYLMNVPPFAATHTEWRTCGPPKDFSLHGLHSSDSELSASDANIQDKVQMIIKSLRSTQSSTDMGDEIVGNASPGQEVHLETCKFGPLVVTKSTGSGTDDRPTQTVFPIKSERQDSDSDDSVDRGIEEAILEYLKEKDGHKRKAEPSTNTLQPSKVPRRNTPVPEISKQHSDSKIVLSASNQFSKIPDIESPMAPVQSSVTKNNSISQTPAVKEHPVKKMDIGKSVTTTSVLPKEPKNSFLMASELYKKVKDPVKEGSDSQDTSSDDGIEEAIQKYQLEKDTQIRSKDACNSFALQNLSDSSSDDGIEEAIRSYQLEQLKEKSTLKPSLHKQRPSTNSPIQSVCSTNIEKINKLKSKKKRKNKNLQSGPPLSSVPLPQSTLLGSSHSNGNGALLLKEELVQILSPATTKTTPAELMCAEAILDISKAVMPAVFSANVGMESLNTNKPLSAPSTTVGDGSSGSSIDSEDGIEQEIRMFLEQKAQMLKQPLATAALATPPASLTEPDKVKGNQESVQKNVLRLSLTQRRKLKSQEDCKKPATSPQEKNELPLKEDGEGCSLVSVQMEPSPASVDGDKTEREGDKSSSLDSDEDLDTAIKDLLKTKKKLKRKTRDLKLKTRRGLNNPESDSFPSKKPKLDRGFFKKSPVKDGEMSEKTKVSRKSTSPQKQSVRRRDDGRAGETDQLKATGSGDIVALLCTNESAVQGPGDSSSVDSDDGIEQEIRKFLAEKAKVSPTETKNKDGDVPRCTNIATQLPEKGIKVESQLAVIPTPENTCLPDGQSKLFQDGLASMTPVTIATACHPSLHSRSPSVLQHTDGDSIVKKEEIRPTIESVNASYIADSEKASARPAACPGVSQPFSDARKWRQSLGLPIINTRPVFPSRPSSHITSPSMNEAAEAAATPPYHRARVNPRPHTPVTLWTSASSSQKASPIPHFSESPVNAMSSSVLNPFSATKHTPGRSPMTILSSGRHRAEKPASGQAEREGRLASPSQQDRGAYTRMDATRRSVQVRVQSRPVGDGREEKQLTGRDNEERVMTADKAVQPVKMEVDNFVDETDCELDERRDPEKTQGVSSMSLSRAIDPGIPLKPYIALTTEERTDRLPRRCGKAHGSKNKTVDRVKRKLTFIPVRYNGYKELYRL